MSPKSLLVHDRVHSQTNFLADIRTRQNARLDATPCGKSAEQMRAELDAFWVAIGSKHAKKKEKK